MPEGPEIRRSADQLAKALVGRRAHSVHFAHEHLKPFEKRLSGSRVTSVASRGKAMLVRFEGDWTIYAHNQLYGRWQVCKPGKPPATGRQLRLAIHNARQSALLYSASDIAVIARDAENDHPFLSKLGPDLLDKRVSVARVKARCDAAAFQRRGLSSLLLDQGFLAGTGNYLRSEILFRAGLAPGHRLMDLGSERKAALAESAVDTTRRSYRTGGITTDPDLVADLKRRGVRYGAYRHFVFGREGKPCYLCASHIRKANYAGRRLYWCPQCQS